MSDADIKSNFGIKNILLWRLTAAVIWTIVFEVFLVVCILLASTSNFLDPLEWLRIFSNNVFTLSIWICLLPQIILIFAQGVICGKDYIKMNSYFPSRFYLILNFISLRNLFLSSMHMSIGLLTSWIFLTLINGQYSSLVKQDNKLICIHENCFYLLCNGVWCGVYYFFSEHLFGVKKLVFPIIEQNKFLHVKSTIIKLFMKCCAYSVLPVTYFVGIYLFYRQSITNFVMERFDVSFCEEDSLDTFSGLTNASFLFYAWLLSLLFFVSMDAMQLLFKVFLTTRHTFPIQKAVADTAVTLSEGITVYTVPIVQNLACMDLFKLATEDKARRKSLYILSQPGGHPHNWNSVISSTINTITYYTEDLNTACVVPIANYTEKTDPNDFDFQSSMYTSAMSYSSPYGYNYLRNMSLPQAEPVPQTNFKNYGTKYLTYAKESLIMHINNFFDMLCKKPIISYMFGEIPDSKIKYLLSQGQPIIWASQGLSLLATVSFAEDSFGIVQKDLPDIISCLVKLKQALDKVSKVSSAVKKTSKQDLYYIQMLSGLKSAAKRSLYNICDVYGPYLDDICLKTEYKLLIKPFVTYTEP